MSSIRNYLVLVMGLAVSACATFDTATRNAPFETDATGPAPHSLDIQEVRVVVPETLRVSEANMYYPGGDIVWRGDPAGDRHEQVKAIFETAMQQGVSQVATGNVPVIMDIQVTRFHALSEKARYTVGGVHALQFAIILRNPETLEILGPPRHVRADFKALGGTEAIVAERHGITQKSRITNHLAEVIQAELTAPEGHKPAKLGLLGAINQM